MILLLGETVAAREINTELNTLGIPLIRVEGKEPLAHFLSAAGELLGKWSLSSLPEWLANTACSAVVDASHPSCQMLFVPLRQWCDQRGIPYLRLERPETKFPENPLIHAVSGWNEALLMLEQQIQLRGASGRRPATVFVTTGSHQLETLLQAPFACQARFVVRVLPEGRLVQKCQNLGVAPRDIVAMQGPFSKELNRALFKAYGTDILLTRDSGPAGGTDTKISAALALNLETILLKRMVAQAGLTVHSAQDAMAWLRENVL